MSSAYVKLIGQSSRSHEENVAKVVGAISSEDLLAGSGSVMFCDIVSRAAVK